MKTRFMYAVLDMPKNRCWQIDAGERTEVSLPVLLADGWRPVRETTVSKYGTILLVLERDGDDSASFGFGFGNG